MKEKQVIVIGAAVVGALVLYELLKSAGTQTTDSGQQSASDMSGSGSSGGGGFGLPSFNPDNPTAPFFGF